MHHGREDVRVRALFRGRRCRWRPRRHRVRVCAALGGRLSLCPPLVPTVFGRGCGGRRAASPFWRPLCAEAAAFRSLPTRRRTVRGPAVAAAWFFPRRVRSQKRSAGAVCGSSAVCADAPWASVTIIPCARHPARVRGRRALGPYQRLHHEHLGPRRHHLNLYTLLASVHCRQDRRARIVKTRVPPIGGRRRSGRRARFVKACVPPIGGRRRSGCRARPVKACVPPIGGRRRSGRRVPLAHASRREAGSHRRAHLEQVRPVTKSGRHHRVWGAPLVKAHLGPPGGRPRRGRQAHLVKVHPLQPGGRRPSGRRVPQARRVKDHLRRRGHLSEHPVRQVSRSERGHQLHRWTRGNCGSCRSLPAERTTGTGLRNGCCGRAVRTACRRAIGGRRGGTGGSR